MIAFEIAIDGRRACTAGVGEQGVTSVVASWVRRPSHNPVSGEALPGRFDEELTLEVGGLVRDADGAPVHLKWLQQPLRLGQHVTLTIVETTEADPPQAREREDSRETERRRREYYERLKAEHDEP